MVEVGSCSEGFPQLEPVLGPLARSAIVAASRWRAYPARQVPAATAAIAAHPSITRCPDPGCVLCRDAIAGGPVSAYP